MDFKKIRGVFFDCWSTLITFKTKRKEWEFYPIKEHAIASDNIDWKEVEAFTARLYADYYGSHLNYEVSADQFIRLTLRYFSIKLDCSVDEIVHHILDNLDPQPVEGVQKFLSFLNRNDIYHAVISNTIYREDDSLNLLDSLLGKEHGLKFFYGSSNGGVKKPNPLIFECGAKPSGLPLSECMYIGDAFYQDVIGSYKAGFASSVWLNWKKESNAKFLEMKEYQDVQYLEVTGYDELLRLMEENNDGLR